MKCEKCTHYHYYLWIYQDGTVRKVDACRLFITDNKEQCKNYEVETDD